MFYINNGVIDKKKSEKTNNNVVKVRNAQGILKQFSFLHQSQNSHAMNLEARPRLEVNGRDE